MTAGDAFTPHQVAWTAEKSARWWNVTSERHQDRYFGKRYGKTVIRLTQVFGVRLRNTPVLDFGCGTGYLLDNLLARGVPCSGADFSAEAVDGVRLRLGDHRLFRGVQLIEGLPAPLDDEAYDTVFFIETVEHLLDDDLHATLKELNRIVRPGGALVVTTPNDEDLAAAESICPDCGCIFHPVQHVRSWDKESLSTTMAAFGFQPVTCRAFYLQPTVARTLAVSAVARGLGRSLPNLLFIGRKQP